MQCPNCEEIMTGEFVPLVKDTRDAVPLKCSHVKSWHYRCDGCDSEWVKVGKEEIRLLDAAWK
jgi:primosomal protein N'